MIFVDTSVWIAFFRGSTAERHALTALLDEDQVALAAPVHLELLSGASNATHAKLRRVLSALPIIFPSRDTWKLVEGWIERAVQRGERFGLGDLLIGAVAAERGGLIWSLDSDFTRMARLRMVRLFKVKRP